MGSGTSSLTSLRSMDDHDSEGTREGARETVEAMKAGAEVIYQGVLFDGVRWRGHRPAWPLPPIAATWGTRRRIRTTRCVMITDAIQ